MSHTPVARILAPRTGNDLPAAAAFPLPPPRFLLPTAAATPTHSGRRSFSCHCLYVYAHFTYVSVTPRFFFHLIPRLPLFSLFPTPAVGLYFPRPPLIFPVPSVCQRFCVPPRSPAPLPTAAAAAAAHIMEDGNNNGGGSSSSDAWKRGEGGGQLAEKNA
ncbi:hypothetical protein DQ04_15281020 [Trypanosoma grayi]|uniref:hypothetical protein n=1 Tax=Trypanosoma grayi TaxID=71804 RepID=UPI0004F41BD7|nr:hypothetical protein DQ04_15281020 [Trypanosoma grayi]KEG06206.1 hypothetical protein DQ04_15281020 [Trypanosoma grayi]